ncbi:head-tail joining protein [Brevundimonas sp.]|uniref:head-tail joining protein n=1 Tax=Brevundimonas sp. TaxID=1871086 RepID=UPI002FC7C54D
MTFNALLADLDATAFAELADDTQAIWTKAGGNPFVLAAILDSGQRLTVVAQMPQVGSGELARLSAAEVAAKAGPLKPADGDTILINGVLFTIHGQPWLDDDMNGRDWLCPVTR